MAVLVEKVKNQKGLTFVMHGLGGFKEQPHIETFARAFVQAGYTAVRFDTTNTFGESDGRYEDATITNCYRDLEDVIAWAAKQEWYEEPFCLAGHSLGGICSAFYAENYPEKVRALAPISTVVSGKLTISKYAKQDLADGKKAGIFKRKSSSEPGVVRVLRWTHVVDLLKYNLLPNVGKLTMPVLLIVGENDTSTPPAHQKILLDKLPGQKELHIIKGAPHTFREPEHLAELKKIFENWIKKEIQPSP